MDGWMLLVRQLREKDPFLAGVVDAGKYAISRSVSGVDRINSVIG